MGVKLPLAFFGVAVMALVVVGLQEIRRPAERPSAPGPATGRAPIRFVKNPQPVPDFTLQDLDGRRISPSDWKGKAAIINFWATWCPPCRAEIPDFIALQKKYGDRLRIIGISVDQGPVEEVRQFVKDMALNYPVAMVTDDVHRKFGRVFGLPTSFVVDPEGRMVQKHVGLIGPEVYEQEVRAMLGMPVDASIETVQDTGQVFLANAAQATEIPGVDLTALSAAEKKNALVRLNSEKCTCGCDLTLAECRINDPNCTVSLPIAKQVVDKIAAGQ